MAYYDNNEDLDKFIEEFRKLSTKNKIIALFIILCLIGIIFSIVYFLKSNNYFIRSFSTILGLSVLIAIILSIFTVKKLSEEKLNKKQDFWLFFFGYTIFMIGLVQVLGSISLKYSNIPYKTTNAFVREYTVKHRHRHWYRYGHYENSPTYHILHSLHFSDRDKRIIGKSIVGDYIPENTHKLKQKIPDSYHCYLVAYRYNVLVVEISEVKNLGAMSKQECWTQ